MGKTEIKSKRHIAKSRSLTLARRNFDHLAQYQIKSNILSHLLLTSHLLLNQYKIEAQILKFHE